MATYGESSRHKLETAHPDLIKVFEEVVKIFDNTIVYGTRSPSEQMELYKKGRSYIAGFWLVTKKADIVTYKDGAKNKSNHNYSPSKAIDAVPYYTTEPHIRWDDIERLCYFAGHVMTVALYLKEKGIITHDIIWGGDWNSNTEVKDQTFMDLAHYEIKDN